MFVKTLCYQSTRPSGCSVGREPCSREPGQQPRDLVGPTQILHQEYLPRWVWYSVSDPEHFNADPEAGSVIWKLGSIPHFVALLLPGSATSYSTILYNQSHNAELLFFILSRETCPHKNMVNIGQSLTHLRIRKVKDMDQDTIFFTRTIFHVTESRK